MKEIDRVHTVGPLSRHIYENLSPSMRGQHFDTGSDCAARITRFLDAGDVVMVKASLGTALGQVVTAIKRLDDS